MTSDQRTDGTARKRGSGRARRSPAPEERQRDPDRTKARILDAAMEEFSAKGYAGARVSEIATRAGVNSQLIAYYFDGKAKLYRELGRRWRAYEASAISADADFADLIKRYVLASVDPRLGGRLLAWDGLADNGEDDEEAEERNARLRREVENIRARQESGELRDDFDPAAFLLMAMSAANALAVYPQLARGLFGRDGTSEEVVEHYADQLARLFTRAGSGAGQTG
jgi:TetR/AcrR family transcriptional regulator